MGRTRRRIEEEKKDQRYNDIQTRHIVSQIAKNISPEGINTMRPSVVDQIHKPMVFQKDKPVRQVEYFGLLKNTFLKKRI